ncbi:unnamed protein product, partial [Rodentolepis nana]|uniref:BHLH domain-containing protein n=1 Tax=Rodentolepis nana TaxID=102285 RepID=A0A0R3TDR3_RODNA
YTGVGSSSHVSLFSSITNQQILPILANTQTLEYSMPAFPVMFTGIPTNKSQPMLQPILPSTSTSQASKTPAQFSERESSRKDKKKYLERVRRSKINAQIRTMYDLVFLMSDEKTRKTEICEMLAECVTVIQSLYKRTMEDNILKGRVPPPESSNVPPMNEEGKENAPPNSNLPTFSPVSVNLSSIQTTSTPIESRRRKRESADSGLEQFNPSTSSSFSWSHDSPSVKKSKITHPEIWRPYQE